MQRQKKSTLLTHTHKSKDTGFSMQEPTLEELELLEEPEQEFEEDETDSKQEDVSDGYDMYREIRSCPILTPEQEAQYGKMLKGSEEERKAAVEALVLHNRRYVMQIAGKFKKDGSFLDYDDLVQEGTIGLITAAKRYDVDLGFRFSTYATWWIRQAIGRAVLNSGTIRLPVHISEKRMRIKKAENELLAKKLPATAEELSKRTGYTPETIERIQQVNYKPTSLNCQVGDEEDGSELQDLLRDPNEVSPEELCEKNALARQISELLEEFPERERQVICMRFGLNGEREHTLEEVGQYYGLTRERIRQIETRALRRFRNPAKLRKIRDFYK